MSRPLCADIDLDALRHNYQLACELAPHSRALAVIKADAYGHGAVACAQALADLAPAFAVATIEEALALRAGGISHPVVLLEGVFEAAEYALASRMHAATVAGCLPLPDRGGMLAARGILTSSGGRTSHAALVARD